jgi:membrane protein implicated in regulation of membrane protease activity
MEFFQNGDSLIGPFSNGEFLIGTWEMLWWHWIALGFLILSLDVFLLNVFYLIWVGLAAICTGIGVWLFPEMPFWVQILSLGFYTALLLVLWLVLLRPRQIGRQREDMMSMLPGQAGTVIRYNSEDNHGELRLQRPIAGKDIWPIECMDPLRPGDRVNITTISNEGIVTVRKEAS